MTAVLLTNINLSGFVPVSYAAEITEAPSEAETPAVSEEAAEEQKNNSDITDMEESANTEVKQTTTEDTNKTDVEQASVKEEIPVATPDSAEYSDDESIEETEEVIEEDIPMMLLSSPEAPTLAIRHDWYKSDVKENTITSVTITDEAPEVFDESWNADDGNTGAITCYISGTDLYIVGNGSGSIKAHKTSSRAFADFTLIETIEGFEMYDTSEAETLSALFQMDRSIGDEAMYELLSMIDMTSCTDISYMLCQCDALVDFSFPDSFDTSNVTSFHSLFASDDLLETVDFSNLNTGSLKNITYLFSGCEKLRQVDFTGFDTSKVTSAQMTFSNCYELEFLDLSSFDTRLVTNHMDTFLGVKKLKYITVGEYFTLHNELKDPSNIYYYEADGYWYAESDGSRYNSSSIWPLKADTYYPTDPSKAGPILAEGKSWYKTTYSKKSIKEVHFVTNYDGEYTECWEGGIDESNSITVYRYNGTLYISSNGAPKIRFSKSCYEMFYNWEKLEVVDGFEMIDSSMVTDFSYMFSMDIKLTNDTAQSFLNSMDFSNCKTVKELFRNGGYLYELTFPSTCDFSKLTDFSGVFESCYNLKRVIFEEGISFPNVTTVYMLYDGCQAIREVDLSMFNNGKIKNIGYVVCSCYNLRKLDLRGFDTSSVTSTSHAFFDTDRLEEVIVDEAFTMLNLLMDPDPTYVPNADGYWHSVKTGDKYNSESVWPVAADTYISYTAPIVPQLMEKLMLYTVAKNSEIHYTEIHFVDSYDGSLLNASNIDKNSKGDVMAVGDGTVLYIVGNGTGSIKAAVDQSDFLYGFNSVTKITGFEMVDFSDTTNLSGGFRGMSSIDNETAQYILENIGPNKITNFSEFFYQNTGITEITIPECFDTSHATNLSNFFYGCNKLKSVDLTNLSSNTYENLSQMFYNCSALTEIDFSSFKNCKNIANVKNLCYGCTALKKADVSELDTSNVTTTGNCFFKCNSIEELTTSGKFNLYADLPYQHYYYNKKANGYWFSKTTGNAYCMLDTWPDEKDTYTCESPVPLGGPTLRHGTTWYTATNRGSVKTISITQKQITTINSSYIIANAPDSVEIFTYLSSGTLYVYSQDGYTLLLDEDSSYLFSDFPVLTKISGNVDSTYLTNMEGMFANDAAFAISNLTSFMNKLDTSNVTNISHLFENCSALLSSSLINNLDLSSVTDMSYCFAGVGANFLTINNPTLTNVEDISYIASNCIKLRSIDFLCFDSGSLKNVEGLLSGSTPVSTVNFTKFNTKNVENSTNMLKDCHIIWDLCIGKNFTLHHEIPDPDPYYTEGVNWVWYSCHTGLTYNSQSVWPTTPGYYSAFPPEELFPLNMLTMGLYFTPMYLNRQEITTIDFDLSYIPEGTELETWDLDEKEFGLIKGYLLNDGKTIKVSAPDFDFLYLNYDCNSMFSVFNNVTKIIGFEKCRSDYLQDAGYMFHACNSLKNVYVENLITDNCIDISAMFYGCYLLEELDLTSWDTSNVISTVETFRECHSLKKIDMSGLDMSANEMTSFMFADCTSLTDLKLCDAPPIVTNMAYMFLNCENLEEIDLGAWECADAMEAESWWFDDCDWITSDYVGAYEGLFFDCESLRKANIGDLKTSIFDEYTSDMFEGCVMLSKVTLPTNFAYQSQLPTPDPAYIEGATGLWYSDSGIGYQKGYLPYGKGTYTAYAPPKNCFIGAKELVGEVFAPFGKDYKRIKVYPAGHPEKYYTIILSFGKDDDYSSGYTCTKETKIPLVPDNYVVDLLPNAMKNSSTYSFSVGEFGYRHTFKAIGIKRWNKAMATAHIGSL